MSKSTARAALGLALLLWACGSDQESPGRAPVTAAQGQALYRARCAWCHDSGTFGAPPTAVAAASGRARAASFAQTVAALRREAPDRYAANARLLEKVSAAPDEERFGTWLAAYVGNPGFDRPETRMQPVQMAPSEIAAVALWLEGLP